MILCRRIYYVLLFFLPLTVNAEVDSASNSSAQQAVCERQSNECVDKHDIDSQLAPQEYYQYLLNQFSQVLPGEADGFSAVLADPAHSRFPYWYLNENLVFNQYTYDYISARVMPGKVEGTVQLSDGNGFSHAYLQVMSAIAFSLSQQTKQQLVEQQKELETLASDLVDVYEYAFNAITPEKINQANQVVEPYQVTIETKLDYVVQYVVGYQWSGRVAQEKPPLNFSQLADAKNLTQLLPDIPSSGAGVLQKFSLYLHSYRLISAVGNGLQYNSGILNALKNNVQFPTKETGGIRTFNPVDGSESDQYQPGYDIGISLADITNALNDGNRTIRLTLKTGRREGTPNSKGSVGKIASKVTFVDELGRSTDLNSLTESGQVMVDVAYQGYVYLPILRASLSAGGQTGWYFSDPIWQAFNNQAQDETGYQFVYRPSFNLGCFNQGGNLATLTGVLIANAPQVTITIDYTGESLPVAFANGSGQGKLLFEGEVPNNSLGHRNYHYQIAEKDNKEQVKTLIFTSGAQLVSDSPSANNTNALQVTVPTALKMADVLLTTFRYPSAEGGGKCQM
ncbi:hypothetical protein [Vibrio pectenicida]|uniref:Uncharacterized protein n=1 Tax=Vibrio pectenicida TaxID=62763 RepID=A0A427U5W1_9VIBR|nr:hypothetical protein [Vibrio pectenicida]RSD32049.1 hypothetical protein EJA03_05740 [Vibrio pectenicida]